MAKKEWRPRLSIELTDQQATKLGRYIPWGMRKLIYQKFTDSLIKSIEKHGQQVLGAFMKGDITYKDLMSNSKDKDGDNS